MATAYRDVDCRDLSEAAIPYCLAKLAYAAGEDEAGDAAWQRFVDVTDSDDREQIEAELDCEYSNIAAWASCLEYEANRIKRDMVKLAVLKAIAAFGVRSAWVPVVANEAARQVLA
jgi:hypothetical protein